MSKLISQFLVGSGTDVRVDGARLRQFSRELATKAASLTTAEKEQSVEYINRIVSAGAGAGFASLNQIEGDYEVLNIFRDSIALDFAEVRPLPVGTLPIYRTKQLYPVNVFMASLTGGASTHYFITKQSGAQVYPFTFGTEKVMMPNLNNLYDMEKLDLRKDAKMQLDRYMEINYNNIAINTVLGAAALADPAVSIVNYCNAGGSFAGKTVYALDPGVQTASVPTVNFYDLTTEGGLTKKVFQTLNTHSIQIGRNFNRMYIPQAAASGKSPVWESLQNLATPVALVTGTVGSADPAKAVPAEMWAEFQKDDFRGEVIIDWFGQRIAVRKQNWLPAGYCLVFGDRPACVLWDRLNLTGVPTEGMLTTPVDGFYDEVSKFKNIAALRTDYMLRNFAALKIQ